MDLDDLNKLFKRVSYNRYHLKKIPGRPTDETPLDQTTDIYLNHLFITENIENNKIEGLSPATGSPKKHI